MVTGSVRGNIMRIGINLVGVSGDGSSEYDRPNVESPGPKGRDWFLTKECVMSQIVNCWEGHDVSLYLTTYDHSDVSNMISFYSPKKVRVLDYYNSNMLLTYVESLKQLADEDLDFIISIRPDIFLFKKLNTYPIEFDKFNFFFKEKSLWEDDVEFANYETALTRWKVHKWPTYHLVNDALFMFPAHMLDSVIEAIENNYNDSHIPGRVYATLHNMWIHLRKFLSPSEINYLISGGPRVFYNMNIEKALKGEPPDPTETEYFLCRDGHLNSSCGNFGKDWKQFVSLMKEKLDI